ncbi:hypothetical protein [Oceanobacillus profundus]|uniref:Uncharacterized protein n=1 Tax=Oceanobacillus profundus TaxID=372463 RepID=A0A417YGU7_9BACI|nr:hypothetical protein [Oceanobacillus profundus]RHW31966.1 hypothetical protein D1B32_12055 [Oceanobacillus profundus]
MRTLYEIVEDMQASKMPTHEECYYALQVYRSMFNIEHRKYREELTRKERSSKWYREQSAELSFDMYKAALSTSPKEWMGEGK